MDVTASTPDTLARLSFSVPPERIEEFAAPYAAQAVPILASHGLVEYAQPSRPTVPGVFARLFAVDSAARINAKVEELWRDAQWRECLHNWGAAFAHPGPDGLLPHSLELYAAPAGPGHPLAHGAISGSWRTYEATDGLAAGFVTSVRQDRDGNMWFGTFGGGVSRFDGHTFTAYTTREGLVHNELAWILQDRDGVLWFATEGGVSRFDGHTFTNFTVQNGLPHNEVACIAQDRDGVLWFATEGGVSRFDGRAFQTLTAADGLSGDQVSVLYQDRDGHMWFGTEAELGRYNDRIAQVVKGLRDFARLDQAKYQLADLRDGLDSALILLQHEFADRIEIEKDYGDIPPIYCYPSELNQVFMNLLVNAVQHIDARGVIGIATGAEDGYVCVRISDSGRGIPSENLSRIFDPGFTTRGVGVGAGLGLSIGYNVVRKHGGRIEVESEVGRGSTFSVRIPVDFKEGV